MDGAPKAYPPPRSFVTIPFCSQNNSCGHSDCLHFKKYSGIRSVRIISVEAGSEGLLVLDHLQGNRSPFMDSNSRGVIRGLTLAHKPIHIFRAIMEGVALGNAVIADTLKESGYEIRKLTVCGEIDNSRLWLPLHADSLRMPVYNR
jgi:ribulose kinase